MELDEKYMREALVEANAAKAEDEIPVGAVIVFRGQIIGKGHNMTEKLHDPTAHAEMIAITAATEAMGGKYLTDCTIYVTVEPCPMCAGAIINARIPCVVFGAREDSFGSCGSVIDLFSERYGHRPAVYSGVLAEDCARLMSDFFRTLRG